MSESAQARRLGNVKADSQNDQTRPRVEVRNLTKTYHTRRGTHVALNSVSIDIAPGEFVVLLGPSGCGKTTLLRCIAGLEEPDSGEIYINGQLVFSSEKRILVPPEKRSLNMVFQSYALWPHMSVAENVAYPLKNAGRTSADALANARKVLDLVGLGTYDTSYPGQMSGGQQQRVALARAIASGDGLVLFDEPLSNLDAKVRDRLRVELLNLQSRIGFSSIYVTHDQVEALALADRVAVMDVGRIAQIGSPSDIYDRPTSRYVADFVGSANEVRGKVTNSGAECSIQTPIGLLKGVVGGGELRDGAEVTVMVRPEHCTIQAPGGDATGNGALGVLERSLYLGSTVQHFVAIGDQQITVTVSNGPMLKPGTEVHVTFPYERTRVFAA